jgi:hypothetical protein
MPPERHAFLGRLASQSPHSQGPDPIPEHSRPKIHSEPCLAMEKLAIMKCRGSGFGLPALKEAVHCIELQLFYCELENIAKTKTISVTHTPFRESPPKSEIVEHIHNLSLLSIKKCLQMKLSVPPGQTTIQNMPFRVRLNIRF